MKTRYALIAFAAAGALGLVGWLAGSRGYGDTGAGRSVPPVALSDARTGVTSGTTEEADRAVPGVAQGPEAAASDQAAPPGGTAAGAIERRTIIRTASLDLTVENVTRTFEDIGRIATSAGGFVASSSLGKQRIGDDEYQVGSITIRVPDRQYEDVMARLRGLAVEVLNEQSESSDVTEEFTDLQARLRNLEATERQYLSFLERARDLDDILVITDRINQVRAEIEQVQGRINLLQNLSELATITVHLTPAAADARPRVAEPDGVTNPLTAAREAWERSLETLAVIASGALAVVVYSWWIAPPLGAAALALRAWWRRAHATPRPAPGATAGGAT